MKEPTIEDVLAFIPKGVSVSLPRWSRDMESCGFDMKKARAILQRLLDPEDLSLVDTDRDMHLVLK